MNRSSRIPPHARRTPPGPPSLPRAASAQPPAAVPPPAAAQPPAAPRGAAAGAVTRRAAAAAAAIVLALAFAWAAAAAVGGAAAAAGSPGNADVPEAARERARLARRFGQQVRAGQLAAAAATADSFLARHPGDGLMAYNLACVQARRGEAAAAWAALERAAASPQVDARQAAADPDLEPLRTDARFGDWLRRVRSRQRAESDRRALVLREGYWSEEFTLEPNDGSPADDAWPRVSVRIQATEGSLQLAATIRDRRFLDRAQPWQNGDGLRVTVAFPPPAGDGRESEHAFGFGFGLQGAMPVGALVEQDGRARPVTVLELAPKIRLDDQRTEATYAVKIPWTVLAPYGPPVDTLLGLNVSYLSVGADRVRRTVSWLPDPALETGATRWRRYVPAVLRPSDRSTPALRGAVDNAVIAAEPLAVQLAAWLPEAGGGSLSLELLDAESRSVGDAGEAVAAVDARPGLNRWRRTVHLADVPAGPLLLRAHLRAPGLDTLRWQTPVLRLDPGWLPEARVRAARAAADERPSLDYRLDAIEAALAERAPRTLPGSLTTTLAETALLLRRLETTGRALPDSGSFLAAYRDDTGALLPCRVWLPPGHRPDAPHRVLVLLPGGGIGEERFGERALASLDQPGDLVVVTPLAGWQRPAGPSETAAGRVAALAGGLRWAMARYNAGPASVAGLFGGAPDALELSLARPELCERVLLWPEAADPWPDASPAEEASRLRARRNRLPYEVVEVGRLPATCVVGDALRAGGFAVRRSEEATDNPSASLVARRLLAWTEAPAGAPAPTPAPAPRRP